MLSCIRQSRNDFSDIGEDRPDPEEEAKVADIGVLAVDGDRARPVQLEMRPEAVGIGGGGLEARRRAALRSPMLAPRSRNASCIRACPCVFSEVSSLSSVVAFKDKVAW